MLKHLQIRNYALIQHLEMTPSKGLTTITGETGAGKSIMLGAVGLLIGNRADTKALLDEDQKCVVEGTFDIKAYDLNDFFTQNDLDFFEECIIRREISPSGKSRAFVNDTPVVLDVLKQLGSYLIDVHSQSDTLLLQNKGFQLQLIDAFAGNETLLAEYQQIYQDYRAALHKYERLRDEEANIRKEADYNQFLFEELEKAQLQEDEQAQLEEQLQLLEHAEEIKKRFYESIELLQGAEMAAIPSMEQVAKNLLAVSSFSQHYSKLAERFESCLIELKDVQSEIEKEDDHIEFDQQKLDTINERLALIYRLQQKHEVSDIQSLLDIRDQLAQKLDEARNLDEHINTAKRALNQFEALLQKTGSKLSEARRSAFAAIKDRIEHIVAELGMPHAVLDFSHQSIAPSKSGMDEVDILFSANKGVKPEILKNVASGGEFSRLMFAIKHILAEVTSMPTIIFDEIDTGISGEIAIKMGAMMKKVSEHHQVITITHLPHIAARGSAHYFVFKDVEAPQSISRIRSLDNDGRILEIAKMIGGDNPSDTALSNAKELLEKV